MKVEVLTGPPGCGKSTLMRAEALAAPGHYLFALPSVRLVKEQAAAFRAEDPKLHVIEAHYKSGGAGSVEEKLNRASASVRSLGLSRAVVLTTHESLMGTDLRPFTGWHFRIDEAPNAATSRQQSVPSPHTREMLSRMFALSPVPGVQGWSEITPTYARHRWREVASDDALADLSDFIKHASRPTGVFVDTPDWRAKKFGWCAVWTPDLLEPYAASVQIAGASYLTSVGALIAQRGTGVSLEARTIPMTRTGWPSIRIHYFTRAHEGTSAIWGEHVGRGFIVKLCDFLAKHEPDLGFWSGNDEVQILMDHRVHGGPIPPKVSGLNEYRDLTSCALIYSAKPRDDDAPLKALFGITDDEIRHGREDEDILQFVMRGALRKPDFDGNYDIYLYSRSQAERLAQQLDASNVGRSVTLHPEVDAGFMDTALPSTKTAKPPLPVVIGASGKPIKARSQQRAEQRKAKRGDAPPPKRGRKPKSKP